MEREVGKGRVDTSPALLPVQQRPSEPGDKTQLRSPMCVAESQLSEPSLLHLKVCIRRKLEMGVELGSNPDTLIRHISLSKHQTNCPTLVLFIII